MTLLRSVGRCGTRALKIAGYGPLSSRSLSQLVSASTIHSPTPEAVQEHLSTSTSETALFLLSTSTPPASLSPILEAIQAACPQSVGSFSSSSPGAAPTLSIARFSKGAKVWYDSQVGRAPAEVGRWQRPASLRPITEEDRKGDRIGELRNELDGGKGWDKVWEPEREIAPIRDLENVE